MQQFSGTSGNRCPHSLRAFNVSLTTPDTRLAHRLLSPGALQQYGVRDAQVRADKAFQPLRRALHNYRAKIHIHADTKRIRTETYRPSYRNSRSQPTKIKRAARYPGLEPRQPSAPTQL